jgi:branched-chain amino acid transport system substrate-binding protein
VRRRNAVAAALLLAVTTLPLAGGAADPYEINAILPQTGQASFLGTAATATLGVIADLVNKSGGIAGRPIKFAIQDDQSNAQVAVQLVNGLIARNVPVMIGPELTGNCGATIPLLRDGPVMYCLSPGVHPPAGSYAFSAILSTSDMLQAIAHYFRERGWTKVAIITSTDATGQDAEKNIDAAFAIEQPETVVDREHFNVSDISVAAQMAHIRTSDAQVMIAWATGTPFGTLVRGAHDAGIEIPVATSNANLIHTLLEQLGPYLPRDLYFAGIPSEASADQLPRGPTKSAQLAYLNAFKAVGVRADVGQYVAWDAAWIVIDALKKLGPNATAAQIHDQIANLHGWVGVNGPYDFHAFPQRGIGTSAVTIARWDAPKDAWLNVSRPGGAPLR